ncbi:interleukin-8-like isoform X1 [Oryctolagus cuniculus]|uniref:interleukin-8-like isoform X1 n=1 Tax=Oryctolagus cuniculus TaxID=9986 RepID=UPI002231077F|nr:interleukin-8-like isoform X1 [Oryctolagus cuniculus]
MALGSSPAPLLLAALVLGIFADFYESQELRCQCIQIYSNFISPKLIKNVQMIPSGPYCSTKEVMVCLIRNLDREAELGLEPRHSNLERGHLKQQPNFCIKCQPLQCHFCHKLDSPSDIERWEINLFGS